MLTPEENARDAPTSLLLVTHVVIRRGPRGPQIDDQTAAGIAQWCRHFDRVTYVGIAEESAVANASSAAWADVPEGALADRCRVLALPRAYRVGRMLKEYAQAREILRQAVAEHRHLCFTIGGLVGDWPAIGAREAIRQKRRYAAWLDRVEPHVIKNKVAGGPLKLRLAAMLAVPPMEQYTRFLVRRSSVSLLQGLDTFNHYARFATDPHCTYDTHTHISDQITAAERAAKQARILDGSPINIVYIGRAAAMKGPTDWLEALKLLAQKQVPFRATWIGDGPELSRMRELVAGSALSQYVRLPGFEGNRDTLLRAMRESDLLLFCHKTPESPRCLIEALVSGCPLVGYDSAYARGLVEARGGGTFVPHDDVGALAGKLEQLHHDRPALSGLVADAAASGEAYNEDAVYAHRAQLMRRA